MQQSQYRPVHLSALLLILLFLIITFSNALPTSLSSLSLNRRIYIPKPVKPVTPEPLPIPPKCNPKCSPPFPPINTENSHAPGDPEIAEVPDVPDDDEILDHPYISNDGGEKEDKTDEKKDKTKETVGIVVGIVGGIVVVGGAGTCWEKSRRRRKRVESERKARELEEKRKSEDSVKEPDGPENEEVGVAV